MVSWQIDGGYNLVVSCIVVVKTEHDHFSPGLACFRSHIGAVIPDQDSMPLGVYILVRSLMRLVRWDTPSYTVLARRKRSPHPQMKSKRM